MKIPKSLIDTFVTSEFPEARLTSTNEYTVNSFFTLDTKKKLYINADSGVFIDFKTDERGSFLSLVREYKGLNSNAEALYYLVDNYNLDTGKAQEETIKEINNEKVIEDFIVKSKPIFFSNIDKLGIYGRKAYNYVKGRNIEESYYSKLAYVYNNNSNFNERIIIPFYENGKIVYFIGRAIDKSNKLRYLTPSGLDSKNYVFNIDKINDDPLILCEGTFDAMSIVEDQPATCLLSADIGIKQMEKIFEKKPKTIIYVPDQDETGHMKMDSNIKKLKTYCPYQLKILVFDVPKGCKDLNDMKIKTGKNYILKKECYDYNKILFKQKVF